MARLITNYLMSEYNIRYQFAISSSLTFKVTGIGDNSSKFLDLIENRGHFVVVCV